MANAGLYNIRQGYGLDRNETWKRGKSDI